MKSITDGRPLLKAELDKVARTAHFLWERGWAERNGGNIVVNITSLVDSQMKLMKPITQAKAIGSKLPGLEGCWFYCKGTLKRMRDLAMDPMANGSIIRICPDCSSYEIVADQPVWPTSELPSHLMIHNFLIESGCGFKASLHTHPTELVAMSHSRKWLDEKLLTRRLWSMIPETLAFAPLGIGVVPYGCPGSLELAEATVEKIRIHDVVLWEKHGTVAVGEDIIEAFDQTDVLNKAAIIYRNAIQMGFEPEGMSDEAIEEIQTRFHLPTCR